jgi:hypothetical protein
MTGEKTYPLELRAVLERGQAGDATALPEIQKAFDQNPELAGMLGDLPKLAKETLLDAVAGSSLTAREATRRQSDRICGELAGWNAPVPVRLLAERVALTWIEVHHADLQMAEALKKRSLESSQMQGAERRAHAAQARFLAAIEALVTVSKLTPPPPSPLDGWNLPRPSTAAPTQSW